MKTTRSPILVAALLILASLACYSDSPLYPYELTPAPPTATPPPPPAEGQARLGPDDLAWVPEGANAAFRLDLTTNPEALLPDLSNKSPQSCALNTQVRVLYSGLGAGGEVYHLVDCNGVVGWAAEANLLGPLQVLVGDRALTTEGGLDENGQYKIEASDPPYKADDPFRSKLDCKLDDTVDIIAMQGYITGELYYKVRCQHPFNPVGVNIGWTTAAGLFGPVRFRNGERGLVPQEVAQLTLLSEPQRGNTVVACEPGEVVEITDTPVQILEGPAGPELYYEMRCDGGQGWANQNQVVGPLRYAIGERVLLTAPGVSNSAETGAPAELEATPTPELTPAPTSEPLPPPGVTLSQTPGFPTADNTAGFCPDASPLLIEALAGFEGEIYAQVTCEGAQGWLLVDHVFGPVNFALGETLLLGEGALLGFGEKGIYLSIRLFDIEGSSGGSRVIAGECAFDQNDPQAVPAQILDLGYYRNASGNVAGVFYQVECLSKEGQPIVGWMNQERAEAREEN